MASFLTDLVNSIFTPGPTPALLVATNASFAGLQLILGLLLLGTHSIHFLILSFLCAGLWWAINWFVAELGAANAQVERETERQRRTTPRREGSPVRDVHSSEDTETEGEGETAAARQRAPPIVDRAEPLHQLEGSADVHKRKSLGEISAENSTGDEWEKVSAEGSKER